MCLFRYESDPEPEEPLPAGCLYVPVREGVGAGTALRLFRTPLGAPTAVGFTSMERLRATLGGDQAAVRLSEGLLRALCGPLGARLVTVDPTLSALPVAAPPPRPGRLRARAL
ncbi:SAV_915 family protein [Streptomyces sp. NPDC056796]|uniref:SAV_915 family protein n=1 Tax=Streptomyces sp. NPDC056796 TaxID=3345947 RepID=UPI003688F325